MKTWFYKQNNAKGHNLEHGKSINRFIKLSCKKVTKMHFGRYRQALAAPKAEKDQNLVKMEV